MCEYNEALPDLVVFPAFVNVIIDQCGKLLSSHFNIIHVSRLPIDDTLCMPWVLSERSAKRMQLKLACYFKQTVKSGKQPSRTSYTFPDGESMYNVIRRAPRYAIWHKTAPLTVCCTQVYRVQLEDLYKAIEHALLWSTSMRLAESISPLHYKTVVVFDLDNTLIDDKCKKLKGTNKVLRAARSRFDYVILWSHGSALHVDENIQKLPDGIFDLCLCNEKSNDIPAPKNLLYLYNYFQNCRFGELAVLVDDSAFNWTPEYTDMIVPNNCKSILPALDLFLSEDFRKK